MFEDIGTKTEKELKDLKEELLTTIGKIDDELENKKKLSKPFRYAITSNSRTVEGGYAKRETADKKFLEYVNKERIGTSLIYYGYTYQYKESGDTELESIMILNNSAVENRGKILGIVRKVFSNQYDLSRLDMSYETMYDSILKEIKDTKQNLRIPKQMEEDFMKLGKMMDKSDFEDKEEFISNAELDYYEVKYYSGKVLIERKSK